MLPGKRYTAKEVARIAWLRRWLVAIPLAIGLTAVPPLSSLVPERYSSETLIGAIAQPALDDAPQAPISSRFESRLPALADQVLSDTRLEQIVQELDLYRDAREGAPAQSVAARMRADIVGPAIEGSSRESFRLGYSSSDPRVAQDVTFRLASLFVEHQNQRAADAMPGQLDSELEAARERLAAHEQRIAAFRQRHAGGLPSQLSGTLQVIQSTHRQLESLGESMNRAREERRILERQLADAQESLQPAAGEASDSPDSFATLERVRTLQAEIELSERQIAGTAAERTRLEASVESYARNVDAILAREQELAALERTHAALEAAYEQQQIQYEASRRAASLDDAAMPERFSVIAPASLPDRPSNRMARLQMMAVGPLAGLVAGLLLVGVLEYRDSSFRTAADVVGALSLPVLATVPVAMAEEERRVRQQRAILLDAATVVLLAGAVVVLVLSS